MKAIVGFLGNGNRFIKGDEELYELMLSLLTIDDYVLSREYNLRQLNRQKRSPCHSALLGLLESIRGFFLHLRHRFNRWNA